MIGIVMALVFGALAGVATLAPENPQAVAYNKGAIARYNAAVQLWILAALSISRPAGRGALIRRGNGLPNLRPLLGFAPGEPSWVTKLKKIDPLAADLSTTAWRT